ncbi:MAG TPA: hypothetical protein VJ975_04810 [Candidatus Limnocylindria bacterium]|nr:hypothetical protein [Candidatus Limnocylindria bacterium]
MNERETVTPASEREDGGPDQTWGQGEGRHEPTIPDEEQQPTSYSGGEPHELDDPDLPLSRETEGMER